MPFVSPKPKPEENPSTVTVSRACLQCGIVMAAFLAPELWACSDCDWTGLKKECEAIDRGQLACAECLEDAELCDEPLPLCKHCFGNAKIRNRWLYRDLPIADTICPYPPGTGERVSWMAERVAQGFAPSNPMDMDMRAAKPGQIKPDPTCTGKKVIELPVLRARGVEKFGKVFRVRIYWEGKKHQIAFTETYEEAAAIALRFWGDKIGLWASYGGLFRSYSCKKKQKRTDRLAPVPRRYEKTRRPQEKPLLFDDLEEVPALRIFEPAA